MLNLEVDGAKLRTAREAAGMSVAALAEKAGCSIWNIYRIERSTGQPSAEVYGRICKALRIKDDSLLKEGSAA
ncbi:helix-turn-helix domain-containing protein [Nocardiopsis composta]|uniref:Transcriptional regulator with XRE-family HTH domain n=1 Tax=Nocardiopsis composta TaxID=157465 RepID=A0A7W8QJ24_9ACTN|nr:helix-turn-helix transcriptional regulator [Nocardiopsis composta]MBB5431402.1 transcriptional regulator with XRE-family HTH domain [Nocardiopsis composta]